MNDRGFVVGYSSSRSRGSYVATLWRDGQAVALETLICADDPSQPYLELEQALDINNRNQIVAFGTDLRIRDVGYYFLEPSLEPRHR